MRKIISFLAISTLASFALKEEPLSEKDRSFALSYLAETRDRLLKVVKNLSDEQLNWKATDSSWSIANCIEHIAMSEKDLFERSQNSLKVDADPARRSEIKYTDEAIIKFITDRSFKAKSPERLRPTGQLGVGREALKSFVERREYTIDYFKHTNDDLRNHFIAHALLGTIDAYQMLIYMSGHTLRHTLQVEEVMASPGFPKK